MIARSVYTILFITGSCWFLVMASQENRLLIPIELTDNQPTLRQIITTSLNVYKDILSLEEEPSGKPEEMLEITDRLIGKLIRLYIYAHHARNAFCSEATLTEQEMHFLVDLLEQLQCTAQAADSCAHFDINKLAQDIHTLLTSSLRDYTTKNER